MFNPVAPYGYLLPTVYLFLADFANPDLFVCGGRTWICLDITRFYEGPHAQKTVNRASLLGEGGFDIICTAICMRCNSFTTCRLCRLEPTFLSHRLLIPCIIASIDNINLAMWEPYTCNGSQEL